MFHGLSLNLAAVFGYGKDAVRKRKECGLLSRATEYCCMYLCKRNDEPESNLARRETIALQSSAFCTAVRFV